ncbi:MAG: DUF1223 domain-containing protein [Bryobacteraceae bacterium]|jgi:hypothetical protein
MKQFILASVLAFAAQAAEPNARVPVLAELFTSEGCSSCPPADALLMKLDQAQPVAGAQVIVLSEHVDYWNSDGWNDPYSSAQFTERQRIYAHSLVAETYTPQIVIDGRLECNGSNGKAILAAVTREAARPKTPVKIVTATRDGNEAIVSFTVGAASGKGNVWVAIADDRDQTSVKRGENSGKTLTHVSVVRSLGKFGAVTKGAGLEKTVRVPLKAEAGDLRVVVFVAESGGPVMGSAMEPLK